MLGDDLQLAAKLEKSIEDATGVQSLIPLLDNLVELPRLKSFLQKELARVVSANSTTIIAGHIDDDEHSSDQPLRCHHIRTVYLKSSSMLDIFTDDVMGHIFSYLDILDYRSLPCVSRECRRILWNHPKVFAYNYHVNWQDHSRQFSINHWSSTVDFTTSLDSSNSSSNNNSKWNVDCMQFAQLPGLNKDPFPVASLKRWTLSFSRNHLFWDHPLMFEVFAQAQSDHLSTQQWNALFNVFHQGRVPLHLTDMDVWFHLFLSDEIPLLICDDRIEDSKEEEKKKDEEHSHRVSLKEDSVSSECSSLDSIIIPSSMQRGFAMHYLDLAADSIERMSFPGGLPSPQRLSDMPDYFPKTMALCITGLILSSKCASALIPKYPLLTQIRLINLVMPVCQFPFHNDDHILHTSVNRKMDEMLNLVEQAQMFCECMKRCRGKSKDPRDSRSDGTSLMQFLQLMMKELNHHCPRLSVMELKFANRINLHRMYPSGVGTHTTTMSDDHLMTDDNNGRILTIPRSVEWLKISAFPPFWTVDISECGSMAGVSLCSHFSMDQLKMHQRRMSDTTDCSSSLMSEYGCTVYILQLDGDESMFSDWFDSNDDKKTGIQRGRYGQSSSIQEASVEQRVFKLCNNVARFGQGRILSLITPEIRRLDPIRFRYYGYHMTPDLMSSKEHSIEEECPRMRNELVYFGRVWIDLTWDTQIRFGYMVDESKEIRIRPNPLHFDSPLLLNDRVVVWEDLKNGWLYDENAYADCDDNDNDDDPNELRGSSNRGFPENDIFETIMCWRSAREGREWYQWSEQQDLYYALMDLECISWISHL